MDVVENQHQYNKTLSEVRNRFRDMKDVKDQHFQNSKFKNFLTDLQVRHGSMTRGPKPTRINFLKLDTLSL